MICICVCVCQSLQYLVFNRIQWLSQSSPAARLSRFRQQEYNTLIKDFFDFLAFKTARKRKTFNEIHYTDIIDIGQSCHEICQRSLKSAPTCPGLLSRNL